MDDKKKQENLALLKAMGRVIVSVGESISANSYDRLTIQRPPRSSLQRRTRCSWTELKETAIGLVTNNRSGSTHKHLADQNRFLLKKLDTERNKTEAFINHCLASLSKLNIKPVKVPKPDKAKENLQFHLLRSDAQVGEKIESSAVQGLGAYNMEIYKERHDKVIEKVLLFKEQDKRSLGLNHLIVHHLGDQVEGESIYPGQPFYLDANLIDQLFTSLNVEANGILALAEQFEKIEIFCVTGNHGRVGKKGDHHSHTNFDYLFYRLLQMALRDQSNVTVFVSESPSMVVRHGNFNFLLNHLDATRGWAGIPYYGVERMFCRLPGLYNMIIDYMLGGHHHSPTNLSDKIIINGCLVGGSDLSINKMNISSLPTQKIFYFHPEHGMNRCSDLILADTIQLEMDDYGIFTPYTKEVAVGCNSQIDAHK